VFSIKYQIVTINKNSNNKVKMSSFVSRSNDLNLSNVIFTTPKPNPVTKKLSAAILNSESKKQFYIESPNLIATFGLSIYDPTNGSDPSSSVYSVPLRVDFKPDEQETETENENTRMQRKFLQFLKGLDEKAIDFGLEFSQQIFKKQYANTPANRGVVEALYSPLVKANVGKDGTQYPDRIQLKLNANDEKTGPDSRILFFKDTATPVAIESWTQLGEMIPKGANVKVIISPQIYIIPGKFGIKLKLIQMKVPNVQRVGRPIGYAFSDPPVEEVVAVVDEKKSSKTDTHADDSDEDIEEIEE
jgi:hypothetical protein